MNLKLDHDTKQVLALLHKHINYLHDHPSSLVGDREDCIQFLVETANTLTIAANLLRNKAQEIVLQDDCPETLRNA